MEKYYTLNLEFSGDDSRVNYVEELAVSSFESTGVMDYSLSESRVDEILGERSYSGGDIPLSVLNEVEQIVQGDSIKKSFFFKSITEAQVFQIFLYNKFDLESVIEEGDVQDWNESWKKNFKPIFVGEDLEIVPSWYENYKSEAKNQLKIYPGMGFGTGNHETTFLCIDLYLRHGLSSQKKCLDFGCGSGILGLAHAKLNFQSEVDLYDIDQEALDNCKQNIEYNELEASSFGLYLPKDIDKVARGYNLIFANILKNVLLDEKENILSRLSTKGHVIISGLLSGQEEEVINSFKQSSNLQVIEIIQKNDWVAVYLRSL